MIRWNNKGDIPIPIVLLTFLVVVLLFTSLAQFSKARKSVIEDVLLPGEVSEVYILENEVNYHVREAFESVCDGYNLEYGKLEFIDRFKTELLRYKNNQDDPLNEAILKIVNNIDESWVELGEDRVVVGIKVDIGKKRYKDGKMLISVDYKYNKQFEKVFEKVFKEETTSLV